MRPEDLFGLPVELPTGKRCSTCKQWKPLDQFNARTTARDGRQWSCRACNAEYHQTHKQRHNAMIHDRTRRVRNDNKRQLLTYFHAHPCVDCGIDDVEVLEFDHLRDKEADISRLLMSAAWPAVLREIAKCEVVCANCHRRRTYRRAGTYRSVGVPPPQNPGLPIG